MFDKINHKEVLYKSSTILFFNLKTSSKTHHPTIYSQYYTYIASYRLHTQLIVLYCIFSNTLTLVLINANKLKTHVTYLTWYCWLLQAHACILYTYIIEKKIQSCEQNKWFKLVTILGENLRSSFPQSYFFFSVFDY